MSEDIPPAPAPVPVPVSVSEATPYRTQPAQLAPFAAPSAPPTVRVWGPTLVTLGVLLWSYVVMGELVTSYGPGKHALLLGEASGVLFVLVATTAAWVVVLRRSLHVAPAFGLSGRIGRGLALAVLPLLGFWAALTFAYLVSRAISSDGFITLVVFTIGVASFVYGRRMSEHPSAPPEAEQTRVFSRVLWAGAALLTFAALIALVSG